MRLLAIFMLFLVFTSCKSDRSANILAQEDGLKTDIPNVQEEKSESNERITEVLDSLLSQNSLNTEQATLDEEEKVYDVDKQETNQLHITKDVKSIDRPKQSRAQSFNRGLTIDSIVFQESVFTFDTIIAGETLHHNFKFTNKNEVAVEVKSVIPDCGCTAPSYPFLAVEPGESAVIGVTYKSVGKSGIQEPFVKVIFNGIKGEKVIKLKGVVLDTISYKRDKLR